MYSYRPTVRQGLHSGYLVSPAIPLESFRRISYPPEHSDYICRPPVVSTSYAADPSTPLTPRRAHVNVSPLLPDNHLARTHRPLTTPMIPTVSSVQNSYTVVQGTYPGTHPTTINTQHTATPCRTVHTLSFIMPSAAHVPNESVREEYGRARQPSPRPSDFLELPPGPPDRITKSPIMANAPTPVLHGSIQSLSKTASTPQVRHWGSAKIDRRGTMREDKPKPSRFLYPPENQDGRYADRMDESLREMKKSKNVAGRIGAVTHRENPLCGSSPLATSVLSRHVSLPPSHARADLSNNPSLHSPRRPMTFVRSPVRHSKLGSTLVPRLDLSPVSKSGSGDATTHSHKSRRKICEASTSGTPKAQTKLDDDMAPETSKRRSKVDNTSESTTPKRRSEAAIASGSTTPTRPAKDEDASRSTTPKRRNDSGSTTPTRPAKDEDASKSTTPKRRSDSGSTTPKRRSDSGLTTPTRPAKDEDASGSTTPKRRSEGEAAMALEGNDGRANVCNGPLAKAERPLQENREASVNTSVTEVDDSKSTDPASARHDRGSRHFEVSVFSEIAADERPFHPVKHKLGLSVNAVEVAIVRSVDPVLPPEPVGCAMAKMDVGLDANLPSASADPIAHNQAKEVASGDTAEGSLGKKDQNNDSEPSSILSSAYEIAFVRSIREAVSTDSHIADFCIATVVRPRQPCMTTRGTNTDPLPFNCSKSTASFQTFEVPNFGTETDEDNRCVLPSAATSSNPKSTSPPPATPSPDCIETEEEDKVLNLWNFRASDSLPELKRNDDSDSRVDSCDSPMTVHDCITFNGDSGDTFSGNSQIDSHSRPPTLSAVPQTSYDASNDFCPTPELIGTPSERSESTDKNVCQRNFESDVLYYTDEFASLAACFKSMEYADPAELDNPPPLPSLGTAGPPSALDAIAYGDRLIGCLHMIHTSTNVLQFYTSWASLITICRGIQSDRFRHLIATVMLPRWGGHPGGLAEMLKAAVCASAAAQRDLERHKYIVEAIMMVVYNILCGRCSLDYKIIFGAHFDFMSSLAALVMDPKFPRLRSAAGREFTFKASPAEEGRFPNRAWDPLFLALESFSLGLLPRILTEDMQLMDRFVALIRAAATHASSFDGSMAHDAEVLNDSRIIISVIAVDPQFRRVISSKDSAASSVILLLVEAGKILLRRCNNENRKPKGGTTDPPEKDQIEGRGKQDGDSECPPSLQRSDDGPRDSLEADKESNGCRSSASVIKHCEDPAPKALQPDMSVCSVESRGGTPPVTNGGPDPDTAHRSTTTTELVNIVLGLYHICTYPVGVESARAFSREIGEITLWIRSAELSGVSDVWSLSAAAYVDFAVSDHCDQFECTRDPEANNKENYELLMWCGHCETMVIGRQNAHICKRCNLTRYCSEKCLEKDWEETHRSVCKYLEAFISQQSVSLAAKAIRPKRSGSL